MTDSAQPPFTPVASASGVNVISAGSGPLLLCLHGIGSSSASFADQLTGLSPLRTVAAWDAPGYGASADPERPLGLDDYIEIIATIARQRGHGKPVDLIGMSWGGFLAMAVAARHPEVVSRLVLGGATRGSMAVPAKRAAMESRAAELAELGPEVFAQARAARLLRTDAPPALVARTARDMAAAIRLPGYGYAAASMAQHQLDDRLGAISAPTLVIFGSDDRVTGLAEAEPIASGIPRAQLAEVSTAGHLTNQENPQDFNRLVADFLTSPVE